ncbi:MAG: hypothetical protein ACYTFG_05790 [Planctomycetota bacterium]|jgi:hypothetical protein
MGKRDSVYDTQELLSLNMDRLKKYMKEWEGGEEGGPDRAEAERKEKRRKRATRLIAAGKKKRQILLVLPDPFHLSKMISINDQRSPAMKLNIAWAEDFSSAVAKMAGDAFRAIVVFGREVPLPGNEFGISGLDFILLAHSLVPKDDPNFLLKKRGFVEHFVPGQTGIEKVTNFRFLKEDYRNTSFLFVHKPESVRDSALAARILGVKATPISSDDVSEIMTVIDKTIM